jgi:putative phosphoribosyl transferase
MSFRDRQEAGELLAARLLRYREEGPVVLGLPRGGVPVAFEVARALKAPLDVWVVRKVGVPWQPELGMGAVAEGGKVFVSREIIDLAGVTNAELMEVVRRESAEVARRVRRFRGERPAPELEGRTVILVDDGIATGGTVRAAIRALRRQRPRRIVLAVPVAAAEILAELRPQVDDLVCLLSPRQLFAIGGWYEDFGQVDDAEVIALLEQSRRQLGEETATVQAESRPGV